MSTNTPAHAAQAPYKVKRVHHSRTFKPDGTTGYQYTITAEHNGGVETQVTVPETPNVAIDAHNAIMQQVNATAALKALPGAAS